MKQNIPVTSNGPIRDSEIRAKERGVMGLSYLKLKTMLEHIKERYERRSLFQGKAILTLFFNRDAH